MMEILCSNPINLNYGLKNRYTSAPESQLDQYANNKFSRHENKCKQQIKFALQYSILYILFSYFITTANSSSISRAFAPIKPHGTEALPIADPLNLKANIANNNKEDIVLVPFKDERGGKASEVTTPVIDPYSSKLIKSLARTTRDFSKDYIESEKESDYIQRQLPFGNGLKYDQRDKVLEITEEKPASMGGVIQSILDHETELRYKHRNNVRIDYKIETYVNKETAKIVDALQKKDIKTLRENHQLVFARLIEPLRTVLALKKFAKDQLHIMERFNKNWYESARPEAKLLLVTKIDQLVDNVPTWAAPPSIFTKVKKTRAFLKSKYTSELINLETEIRAQKIIREYMQGVKVLKHYTNFNAMYLAPFYTELVPALGSSWLNHLFDKYYMSTVRADEPELAENLPHLMARFLMMVEQNAITVTSDDFQKAIYAFSLAVSKVMVDKKINRYKLPKVEYFGFMGVCNDECEEKIFDELQGTPKEKPGKVVKFFKNKFGFKKEPASAGLKFIRYVMTYQKTDLMVIETFAEKVIIQLILRTNNIDADQVANYHASAQNNVKLNIDIKTVNPNQQPKAVNPNTPNPRVLGPNNPPVNKQLPYTPKPQFIQKFATTMKRNMNKLGKKMVKASKIKKVYRGMKGGYRSTSRYLKRAPLVKWILSGVNKLNKMRKRPGAYVCYSFVNVLKPALGLDSNILSTHSFIKDLVEVGQGSGALSNWYNHTMQTWILVSSAHSSLHGFDPQMDKDAQMSKSLGALFRWLNSTDTRNSIVFTNKDKTVLASLSLQLAFFMDNSVRMYTKNGIGKFLAHLRNIFKMGKTAAIPGNWQGLNEALEPQAVVSRPKFATALRAVLSLVRLFEDRFILKPTIPARLIQMMVIFVGMWTKNQHQTLDLTSNKIEPARKHFYTSLLTNKGIPHEAVKMILEHCKVKSRRKALHLGCINKVNGVNLKCRPIRIRLTKSSLFKVIDELHGTLDDPLDTLRMASDLSKRCMAHNTQKPVHVPIKKKFINKLKKKLYGTEEYTGAALLASEFSQRLHCYKLQKKVAKKLARKIKGANGIEEAKEIFNKILNDYQTMEIKMKAQNDFGAHKLMCQFMNANNPEIVKVFKARLLKYALGRGGAFAKDGLTDDDLAAIIASDIKPQEEYAKEIHNYHSYILVGTRFFNSITYRGGYPPNHIFDSQEQVKSNGPIRSVFNGNGFVDELEELRITDPVANITIETPPGESTYRRYYHLTTGEKLDEYQYALVSNNFVVTGSVLTTSRALAENGYDSGMIIWCGFKDGWVADFALRDVVHDINAVPLFNGRNWVLSTETRIKDFIGANGKKNFGLAPELLDKKVDDVNVVYKMDNGAGNEDQNDTEYLSKVFEAGNQGSRAPVLSTGATDFVPGAVEGLVKDTEYKNDTNTLVIDLNATNNLIQGSGVDFVRLDTPPNGDIEPKDADKAD